VHVTERNSPATQRSRAAYLLSPRFFYNLFYQSLTSQVDLPSQTPKPISRVNFPTSSLKH
jgi:hypothetical protein